MVYKMDKENWLIIYDCKRGKFTYPEKMGKYFSAIFDNRPLWQIIKEDTVASVATADQIQNVIDEIVDATSPQVRYIECPIKTINREWKWHMLGFICPIPKGLISITVTDVDKEVMANQQLTQLAYCDKLTELYELRAFYQEVETIMQRNEQGVIDSEYALIYFDVLRFKAINDIFGVSKGDQLLFHIAKVIKKYIKPGDVACRMGADKFGIFTHTYGYELTDLVENILSDITKFELSFEIICNMGIYITKEEILSVDLMIDRAVLAQSVIKGSYTIKYNYYTEELRNKMLTEQEISGMMSTALAEEQFVAYYQPQYNHTSGALIGAEALVRWKHPERGLISPGVFIPIFEKNGFITIIDLYMFELTCKFLNKCRDRGTRMVPISTNFSRHDIFQPDFVDKLEKIRLKYDIPVEFLRVEITESAVVGGSQHSNDIVQKLHKFGYVVEMDDFGSGYSSLNVLKDIEMDIIKLDMLFLSEKTESNRGGIILSSVVRMAKWLGLPVIAEGVETMEQADFLKSIGCDDIQGYLYSRPLPEEEFEKLLVSDINVKPKGQLELVGGMDSFDFWNPKSQETLIFSNYVGGAAIFSYYDDKVEILRVNQKYMKEIGMNQSEKDVIESDFLQAFDEENRKIYVEMIERAIQTEEEQECDAWRMIRSECCGDEKICIRSNIRVIAKSPDTYLFYTMIRNVTIEKQYYEEISNNERRFKHASEQINIYYWEYNVETKEMRPCFRCMRDLGLPEVLTNYPDSAIEMGVFPPEVADMYRDWHVQIANGVKELEAVIPLTLDRVPFKVRYTTEFDVSGRPVKAYGSAVAIN